MDLKQWMMTFVPWSSKTFGPGMRTEGLLKHIAKEMDEVRKNPSDVTEWIDIAILALDGAWRASFYSDYGKAEPVRWNRLEFVAGLVTNKFFCKSIDVMFHRTYKRNDDESQPVEHEQ